ncbi:selenium metabolism-associated LysR family transcriptional regulator [Mesobacillus zeae]|uniref:LysR family transcriptional regulator n=1 Tax=Mesobacillus zeae TaxID=1917180 RepID=A0A398BD70_9BACI|nr:selenium metabolism-associated LysR family transcriptional regulator [Mesobacillus zeae]RID87757.1 LysR family transcriptional regulator [Mesobacillus zeae]
MDLHQLYVFSKVVEHKSFSKAAEDIFLSQSTVSSHVQALEKSLDIKLFDRFGRETILTPHGERLYQWAQKLLLLKEQALLDVKQGLMEYKGAVKIAASSVPGQFLLPAMIRKFRADYPLVTFHIRVSPSRTVAEKVRNGSVDFGILGEKYEDDKLQYTPLLKEKLVLITPMDIHIDGPASIQKILEFPFVMRDSGSGTNSMLEKHLKRKGISKDHLNISAFTDSGQSLIQLVKEGIGISIVSEIAARPYQENKMIHMYNIEDFTEERYFYLACHKARTLSMASKLFIDKAASLI